MARLRQRFLSSGSGAPQPTPLQGQFRHRRHFPMRSLCRRPRLLGVRKQDARRDRWYGAPPGFTLGVLGYLEQSATFKVVDKASVTGVHPRDLRRKTRRAAMLTMKENPNPKISTGILPSIQVVMLLRWNPEDTQLSMAFEIDLRTGLRQHSKRTLRSFFRHAPGSRDNGLRSQMP